jgi:hypothetical protein
MSFRPDLTGEFRIVLQEAPPIVTPPTLRVEAADALEAERLDRVTEALAARVRGVLVFTRGSRRSGRHLPARRTEDAPRTTGMAGRSVTEGAAPLIVSRSGRVASMRLNRPQVLNALDPSLVESLRGALEEAGSDPGVGCSS